MKDPLVHIESEDTDIDAEQIDALRKEVLKYTDQVVEEARKRLTMKITDSSDKLETRFGTVVARQGGQDEMIRQLANMFNDYVDKGSEVTMKKQQESERNLKKA